MHCIVVSCFIGGRNPRNITKEDQRAGAFAASNEKQQQQQPTEDNLSPFLANCLAATTSGFFTSK